MERATGPYPTIKIPSPLYIKHLRFYQKDPSPFTSSYNILLSKLLCVKNDPSHDSPPSQTISDPFTRNYGTDFIAKNQYITFVNLSLKQILNLVFFRLIFSLNQTYTVTNQVTTAGKNIQVLLRLLPQPYRNIFITVCNSNHNRM